MLALSLLLLLHAAPGQTEAGAGGAGVALAEPYVDGTHGFSLRPPKGWRLIRRQVPEPKGVTLLRMVAPLQEIVLRQTATAKPVTIEEMLAGLRQSALGIAFSRAAIRSQQIQEIAGRPGAVLATTFQEKGLERSLIQAVVEVRPQAYFVLSYSGPASQSSKAEPLFHMVLSSLRLLSGPFDEAQLKRALGAGAQWLAGIAGKDLHGALVPEQYLRFELDGRPVGFVGIQQIKGKRRGDAGVLIRERGWMFEKGGWARRLQSNLFLSDGFQQEHWKTSVTTFNPAQESGAAYLDISIEEGLRTGDTLLSNQLYQWNQPMTTNPPIEVPKTYISRALVRLLPRLVGDLSVPRTLAFVQYDHPRADLAVKVVELKGEAESPTGVARGKVYRIEEREGMAGEPSSLYVDASGGIVLVQSGKLTMRPARYAKLEAEFGARMRAAQEAMARLEAAYRAEEERFRTER